MTTQDQFAALMQQTAQLTAMVTQMVQLQQAQQASVGSAPSSRQEQAGLRTAKVFDLSHLKYTMFDNTPWKYDDWGCSFKRAILSANCDAYKLLTHVERESDDVGEYGMDEEF